MKSIFAYIGLASIILGALFLRNIEHAVSHLSPTIPNRLVAAEESVAAAFSFQTGNALPLNTSIAHVKLLLTNPRNLGNVSVLRKIETEARPVMITVETWGSDLLFPLKRNPLDQVTNGEFDDVLIQLFKLISQLLPKVYIRFNPEMEVPAHNYPWQNRLINYLKAYHHFAGLCRQYAPKANIVWAPAGYPGAMECYPGDEVVDAATITLKSSSEKSLSVYPQDYTIQYDLRRRLHRLRFIDKPVFVLASDSIKSTITQQLIDSTAKILQQEKEIVYSPENFVRPVTRETDSADQLIVGLYDPHKLLVHEPAVAVEHLFVDFGSIEDGSFEKDFRSSLERGHMLIITFEPFRQPSGEEDLDVLANITSGKYDRELTDFFDIICSTSQRIYLRYAHEMEIPITRYPWQSQDPITYMHSFRYFMQFRERSKDHIQRVWGPAGDRGSIEWYPGNDVVDVLSIAIYGLPDKNITDPNMQESFSDIFYRKTWRLRFIDKPIFITEFGVKGPEEYQTNWLLAAAGVLRENKHVIGINYFNMSDTPKAWGDIKPPDWSITKASFEKFIDALNKK